MKSPSRKITLVTRNFPPLTGGMERLVFHVYQSLIKNHHCTLIGPTGCKNHIPDNQPAIESKIAPTPFFLVASFLKALLFHLKSEKPEIVIGGSGLVAPVVFLIAKLFNAKAILLIHGLDLIVHSRIYQALFIPFIQRCDLLICNSQNTARLAIEKGIPKSRIRVIHPGVEPPEATIPQPTAKEILKKENKTILLSVGRLIPRKGLPEFIEKVLPELLKTDPSIELVIIGTEPGQALNNPRESTLALIQGAIKKNNLEQHVYLMGNVSDTDLEQWYSAADVFVFPLKDTPGDVEGFGMVAVEAAARGTPTVAFDCGGVADAIQKGVSGYLVPTGSYDLFAEAIRNTLNQNMRTSAREFALQFGWKGYSGKLEQAIEHC